MHGLSIIILLLYCVFVFFLTLSILLTLSNIYLHFSTKNIMLFINNPTKVSSKVFILLSFLVKTYFLPKHFLSPKTLDFFGTEEFRLVCKNLPKNYVTCRG